MTENRESNGPRKTKRKRASGGRVPGLDLRELIQERNWAALAGLGLIGLALLMIVQRSLGLSFNLWSLLLLGIGGWIVYDTLQIFRQQGRTWTAHTRNRMLAGGLVVLIALMGMLAINWWGLLLLVVGGWLGFDTFQKVEARGGVWTQTLRNRMLAGVVIGGLGALAFFSLGSAWSVILIVIGGFMLCRHFGKC